jgi:hypothetical protein
MGRRLAAGLKRQKPADRDHEGTGARSDRRRNAKRHFRTQREPPTRCGPLRHPIRPGLSLASCRLIPSAITAGASRVASGLLCLHAVANIPAGSMELVRSSVSIASGLPREIVRSAPATTFSGPAQRSLTLRPARSRSRQATLYTEGSDSFVASAAASIASGWSEPVPGREFHPLKSSAFHGARFRQLSGNVTPVTSCDVGFRPTMPPQVCSFATSVLGS